MEQVFPAGNLQKSFKQEQERGFNIEFVKDVKENFVHSINQTMMRINLASNEAR
jgi:hypothetical protein